MSVVLIDKYKALAEIATDASHVLFGTVSELFWVELEAVDGHRIALSEHLDVLRSSPSPTDAISRQLDLVPESRRRLQRTRVERAHTLNKFSIALRELIQRSRSVLTAR